LERYIIFISYSVLVLFLVATLEELAFSDIHEIFHVEVSVFKPDDLVSKVLGVLKRSGRYEAVVSSGSSVGLITVRDALAVDQPSQTKVDNVWRATGGVSPEAKVVDVTDSLVRKGVRALPVVTVGEVVGIFSQVDLIKVMGEVKNLEGVPVKDLMRAPVLSVEGNKGIAYARRLMLERNISHLPVVERGSLVGIVTAESIVHNFITSASRTTTGYRVGERAPRFSGRVSGIMDSEPCTVGAGASIFDVILSLKEMGKGACIITSDSGNIIGIITPRELVGPLLRFKAKEELPVYIIGLSDEDFFERVAAEKKVRRVVSKSLRFRPDITEVSVRIKRSQTQGNQIRYEVTARALATEGQINADARGWGLLETFDVVCATLGKAIRRSKPETPGRTRMRRSRISRF
jgi:CBS domain-containing protein/ribosome-associated translation inhibitor RaiA